MEEFKKEEEEVLPPPLSLCHRVPPLLSAFVDTFVDFVVGAQFLGPSPPPAPIPTRLPPVDRLVSIGDIHGDLSKARQAFQIAGLTDHADRWIGGDSTVVQVGDLLDRGGQELKVIYFLEKLRREARRAGGDVIVMNGNHEIMSMEGDFRYATQEALQEFQHWARWYTLGSWMKEKCDGLDKQPDIFLDLPESLPEAHRARLAALRPGGPISARFLARHPTVLMVGETVFVHGGLLPTHANYGLEKMNEEVRQWMLGGSGLRGPPFLHGRDAVVWLRSYSELPESKCDCDLLSEALQAIPGAARMVVGHTIQHPFGINGVCRNQVIRVDVGMSKGCGDASPEVLEIRKDRELSVLTGNIDADVKARERVPWREEKPGLGSLLTENGTRHGVQEVQVKA